MQLFDWSTTVRKVVVVAKNTVFKSETVLEMTVAGLDGHWETTAPLMHRSCNDDVIQLSPLSSYAVLEVVEISHAWFVHLVLQDSPHTSHLDLNPANLDATVKAEWTLAKTAFLNDVTNGHNDVTPSLRTVAQVLVRLFYNFLGPVFPPPIKSTLIFN